MRRFLGLFSATVLLPLVAVGATQQPASAENCSIGRNDLSYTRVCVINSSRIAGKLEGSVRWEYPGIAGSGQQGYASLKLTDTSHDGVCAWVRFRYAGGTNLPQTQWESVCGVGNSRVINRWFNYQQAPYNDGWFYIDHCSPKSSCINEWAQAVADRGPGIPPPR